MDRDEIGSRESAQCNLVVSVYFKWETRRWISNTRNLSVYFLKYYFYTYIYYIRASVVDGFDDERNGLGNAALLLFFFFFRLFRAVYLNFPRCWLTRRLSFDHSSSTCMISRYLQHTEMSYYRRSNAILHRKIPRQFYFLTIYRARHLP